MQLGHAAHANLASRNLRSQIPQGSVGEANVVMNHLPHAIVSHARVVELDGTHLNAFVKNLIGLHVAKTCSQTTDIDPVGSVGRKSHHLAFMKTRGVDDHIVQMLPTHRGMVHDDHVPGLEAFEAVALDPVHHGDAQIGQKDGQSSFVLTNHVALGVNETAAKIPHLVHHHVVGRFAQGQGHFFRKCDQRMGDHFKGDGVDGLKRLHWCDGCCRFCR